LPWIGTWIKNKANNLNFPDVSAQILGELEGEFCCGCTEACEVSLNGSATIGNGKRGGGMRTGPGFAVGGSVEINGKANICDGTVTLEYTLNGSVGITTGHDPGSANVPWYALSLNAEFEDSGTLFGPETFSSLDLLDPCK